MRANARGGGLIVRVPPQAAAPKGKLRPTMPAATCQFATCAGLRRPRRELVVVGVADLGEREALRRHHLEVARALAASQQCRRARRRRACPPPRRRSAPTSARTMLWQNASACSDATSTPSSSRSPSERLQRADRRRALARPADTPRSRAGRSSDAAAASIASTSSVRGYQTVCRRSQRVARGRGVGDAVLVASPDRPRSGRRSRRARRSARVTHDVGVGPDDAVEPARERRLGRLRRASRPRPRAREPRELRPSRQVEVGDLARGVHAGIRAPGDGERGAVAVAAEDRARAPSSSSPCTVRRPGCRLQPLNVGAVVGDVEADAHDGCRGIRFDDVLVARVDRLAHDHQPTAGRRRIRMEELGGTRRTSSRDGSAPRRDPLRSGRDRAVDARRGRDRRPRRRRTAPVLVHRGRS